MKPSTMTSESSPLKDAVRTLAKSDPILTILVFILLGIGLLFVYGAGRQIGGRFAHFWLRHLAAIIIGLAAMAAITCVDYRRLGLWSLVVFVGATALLAAVLVIGLEINAARRWLDVGPLPRFQPAELAKPATIVFLAWLASRRGFQLHRLLDLGIYAAAAALPVILIGKQPDWGTALVFVPIALAIAFTAGLPWRIILAGVLLAAATAPLGYHYVLGQRQRERIQTFIAPSRDITNTGWNAHQSLLAVSSGGLLGKGYMKGTQHVLGYLPRAVAPSDFIFSVIGEETGLIGSGALVCAYLAILICCLRAAAFAGDSFGAYICVGVAAMIFTHVYVNIGMTVLVAPITGLPLPLVSYGGTFMLTQLACFGLVQNVYVRRKREP